MSDFQTMFPSLDPQLIECVLRDNNGVVHTTVDSLLRLSESAPGSAALAMSKRRQAAVDSKAEPAIVGSPVAAAAKPDDLPPSYEQRVSGLPAAASRRGRTNRTGRTNTGHGDRHHTHPPKHSRQGGSGRHGGGIRHGLSGSAGATASTASSAASVAATRAPPDGRAAGVAAAPPVAFAATTTSAATAAATIITTGPVAGQRRGHRSAGSGSGRPATHRPAAGDAALQPVPQRSVLSAASASSPAAISLHPLVTIATTDSRTSSRRATARYGYGADQSPMESSGKSDVGGAASQTGAAGGDDLNSQLRHMGKMSGRRFAEMARKFFGMARQYKQRRQQHLLLHQPQLLTMSAQTESTLNLLENGDFEAEDDGEVNPVVGTCGGGFCGEPLEEETAGEAAGGIDRRRRSGQPRSAFALSMQHLAISETATLAGPSAGRGQLDLEGGQQEAVARQPQSLRRHRHPQQAAALRLQARQPVDAAAWPLRHRHQRVDAAAVELGEGDAGPQADQWWRVASVTHQASRQHQQLLGAAQSPSAAGMASRQRSTATRSGSTSTGRAAFQNPHQSRCAERRPCAQQQQDGCLATGRQRQTLTRTNAVAQQDGAAHDGAGLRSRHQRSFAPLLGGRRRQRQQQLVADSGQAAAGRLSQQGVRLLRVGCDRAFQQKAAHDLIDCDVVGGSGGGGSWRQAPGQVRQCRSATAHSQRPSTETAIGDVPARRRTSAQQQARLATSTDSSAADWDCGESGGFFVLKSCQWKVSSLEQARHQQGSPALVLLVGGVGAPTLPGRGLQQRQAGHEQHQAGVQHRPGQARPVQRPAEACGGEAARPAHRHSSPNPLEMKRLALSGSDLKASFCQSATASMVRPKQNSAQPSCSRRHTGRRAAAAPAADMQARAAAVAQEASQPKGPQAGHADGRPAAQPNWREQPLGGESQQGEVGDSSGDVVEFLGA
uniref:CUE domain-containing protein n=1 Tax=Macrostomum lignano TaxID=282301 RepID=A0A1I8F2Z8_9PLAT